MERVEGQQKKLVSIGLGLSLADIPQPEDECHHCGSSRQKEFIDWESFTEKTEVVAGAPIPAYGCTGCGLKDLYPPVMIAFFEKTAEELLRVGDERGSQHFTLEARSIREIESQR